MKKIATLFIVLGLALTPVSSYAATSDAELVKQLERIFNERPELVLNVLRNNSEAILEIAQEGSTKKRKRSLEAQWQKDLETKKNMRLEGRPVWGAKNAPVTIVEFSDFTCPYCAQAANTLSQIKKAYGDQVNLVFKHTPLSASPTAILASEYVIAAGFQSADKAQLLYEKLFAQRTQLLEQGETFIKEEAKRIGLDMKKLIEDIQSDKTKTILQEDLTDGKELGVEGTPYFFVNDIVIRGALSGELFKAAIDMALKAAKK